MKTLIIVFSYHHNNTQKIAEVMAEVLDAKVKAPEQVDLKELEKYDLIGFGSGIDSAKHYPELLDFAENLPQVVNKKAFIFSTSAIMGEKKVAKDHSKLRNILQAKGYLIVDEFACKGFNTNLFLKYFGGMNKKRPNESDFKNATDFATNLEQKN